MSTEEKITSSYVLRASLIGHLQDVRVVAGACYPEGAIITGSRDLTTRIWTHSGESDFSLREAQCLKGPSGFISAICSMPPSDQFPQGLVLVGSHDCNIYCFSPESSTPLYKLLGHSGAVCSLAAGEFGNLVSGSWDKTARVWSAQKCMMTLEGHQGAVWAVAFMPQQGLILTGSADKFIRLWRAGNCEKTFSGHTDCVRGLAILSTREFLSCSNDATIRHWECSGDCLHVYESHTSFVYSIAALEDSDFFVSCGEDRTVRVWDIQGGCKQTINMPCTTVWSVALLPNGDIVAGCSDGEARVFTRHEALKASPTEIRLFEGEVSKTSIPQEVLGEIKLDELPGNEILNKPGKHDGHTVLVNDGGTVNVFTWSAEEQKWQKVGHVTEKPEGNDVGKKIVFEGKEYDFVFNVDIDDKAKPLKLPYSVTEDPWVVAQAFIYRHQLPQDYLDKIANFIITNAKTTGPAGGTVASAGEYCDPFTGGSRYIPGSSRAASIDTSQNKTVGPGEIKHIPYTGKWIAFDIANTSGMLHKLKEFNGQVPPQNIIKQEEDFDELRDLIECKVSVLNENHIRTLETMFSWPDEFIFPVLDVLRCAIRSETVNTLLCGGDKGSQIVSRIVNLIASPAPANCMLALRFCVNMFVREAGQNLAKREWERILKVSSEFGCRGNKNTQIALGSLYINYVILSKSETDSEDVQRKQWILQTMCDVIAKLTDAEAQFRLVLALGTLVYNDKDLCSVACKLNLVEILSELCSRNGESQKLLQCSQQCINHILDA